MVDDTMHDAFFVVEIDLYLQNMMFNNIQVKKCWITMVA